MQLRDIMTCPVFAVGETDSLKFAEIVMQWKHIRHLPVIDDENNLIGLITHRDILRASVSSVARLTQHDHDLLLRETPVVSIMETEVTTAGPDEDARQCARKMLELKLGCVPVVEKNKLIGIVTEADFVRGFLEMLD